MIASLFGIAASPILAAATAVFVSVEALRQLSSSEAYARTTDKLSAPGTDNTAHVP